MTRLKPLHNRHWQRKMQLGPRLTLTDVSENNQFIVSRIQKPR